MQLHNTPDPDCDISHAEIVFGRPLRDAFCFVNRLSKFTNRSICRTWREARRAKEDTLCPCAGRNDAALRRNSCLLGALHRGDHVFLLHQTSNNPLKWDKVSTVTETLGFDHYAIKVGGSGRITKRNRCFL